MSAWLHLTDEELVVLDTQCTPETQAHVNAAKARLGSVAAYPGLTPGQASLLADAVTLAKTTGLLRLQYAQLRSCSSCGKQGGYRRFKSGWRKGEQDHKRPLVFPGLEMGVSHLQGHAGCGGCRECVETITPALTEALRGVQAQVPEKLRAEGEPIRKRHPNKHCTKCGWSGHEGEMGQLRTVMGDGYYPGACPQCFEQNRFLGATIIESAPGFTIVESPAPRSAVTP